MSTLAQPSTSLAPGDAKDGDARSPHVVTGGRHARPFAQVRAADAPTVHYPVPLAEDVMEDLFKSGKAL